MKLLFLLAAGFITAFSADERPIPKVPLAAQADDPNKPATPAVKLAKIGSLVVAEADADLWDIDDRRKPIGTLFKNLIAKIKKISADREFYLIESEYGAGWVSVSEVNPNFDRKALQSTYQSSIDMNWFFDRFNNSSYYDEMNLSGNDFSAEEIRSMIEHVDAPDEEGKAARAGILALLRDPEDSPRSRYFSKVVGTKQFWSRINSESRALWSYLPKTLLGDKAFLKAAVGKGAYLVYDLMATPVRDDAEITSTVMQKSPESLKFASDRLKDDEKTVLTAAVLNPLVVEFASKRLRDSDRVFKKIATVNAMSIQFASDRLKNDPEFIKAVCPFRPWSIQYASKKVLDNEDVMIKIGETNPLVTRLASERIQNDAAVLKRIYLASAKSGYQDAFYQWIPAKYRHQVISP